MGNTARTPVDATIYREEDDVGEHEIQTYILEVLRPLVERYLREQGVAAHVGSDQYIYWRQHDPLACVAPDLYVLRGVPQEIAIDVWKVWERGVVPEFVIEVVGRDPHKDYEEAPRRYAELGVDELIVFDPFEGRDRVAFSVYRRDSDTLQRVEATNADRVFARSLACFVRRVGEGAATRLRLGTGARGDEMFPTPEEAQQAERAAKEAALQRIAELEAELARCR